MYRPPFQQYLTKSDPVDLPQPTQYRRQPGPLSTMIRRALIAFCLGGGSLACILGRAAGYPQMAPGTVRNVAAARTPACRRARPPNTASIILGGTNDVHNQFEEVSGPGAGECGDDDRSLGQCIGGYGRLTTFFKQLARQAEQECAASYVVDAGDQCTGGLYDIVYRGNQTARMMRMTGYSLTTLGNHEFDWSLHETADYAESLARRDIDILGACSIQDWGPEDAYQSVTRLSRVVKPWAVRQFLIPGGGSARRRPAVTIKVGFIGILTPSVKNSNSAGKPLTMLSVEDSYDRCLASLREAHPDVDMVIALSHIGMEGDKAMAPKLKGRVDVVIGGHSHDYHASPVGQNAPDWFKTQVYDDDNNQWITVTRENCADEDINACVVPLANTSYPYYHPDGGPAVLQAGFGSMFAHGLRLNFDVRRRRPRQGYPRGVIRYRGLDVLTAGGQAPALMGGPNSTNPIVPDPAVQRFIATIAGPVQEFKTKQIGFAFNDVPKYAGAKIKYLESPLSDYVSDGWQAYTVQKINPAQVNPAVRATIGITQLGGIRSDVTAGVLTYADALRVLPFGNLLWVKDFPAKILLQAYLHGITEKKWLKTSGRVRVYQTAGAGETVTFKSLWVLFDGDSAYTRITETSEEIIRIATTDYLINGGNGYTMLTTNGVDVLDGPGDNVADLLAAQFTKDYETQSGTNFQIDPNNPRIIQCEFVNCAGTVAPLFSPCCV